MKILLYILLFPIFFITNILVKIGNIFTGSKVQTFKHPNGYYSCLLPKNFTLLPANTTYENGDYKTFFEQGTLSSISICVMLEENITTLVLEDAVKTLCHSIIMSYKDVEPIYIKDITIDGKPAKKVKARYHYNGEEHYLIGILTLTNNYPINIIIKCVSAMPGYIDMLTESFLYNFKITYDN